MNINDLENYLMAQLDPNVANMNALRGNNSRDDLGFLLAGNTFSDNAASLGRQMMEEKKSPLSETLAQLKIIDDMKPKATTPSNAAKMATEMGYEPGTPEYRNFIQQIALKPDVQIGAGQSQYGNIPSGYNRYMTPEGQPIDRPNIGSTDYQKATGQAQATYQNIANAKKMIQLVKEHGSEAFGDKSKVMSNLYGDIIAAVADLQNKGVLQQGEMEQVQQALPNPGDWGSTFTANDSILAAYEQFLSQLESKLEGQKSQFDQWGYDLPSNPHAPKRTGKTTVVDGKTYYEMTDGSWDDGNG